MYRVRSTGLWYNAPGVVAAYQPIAAPDAFAARQNVGNDGRMAERHMATAVGSPAFASATGWSGFSAANYFSTGVIPAAGYSMIVQFAGGSGTAWSEVAGSLGSGTTRFRIHAKFVNNPAARGYSFAGVSQQGGASVNSGVMAITPGQGFFNGLPDHTPFSPSWSGTAADIFIGTYNGNGTASNAFWTGAIGSCVIYACKLSASAIWQYSRQMAYCHVNPDWSAWGRRRRYYYAPSAAGFQAAWSGQANRLIGGGADRV